MIRAKDNAKPAGMRRALSHVGGRIEIRGGSAEQRAALTTALDVQVDEAVLTQDIHGFHSYAARLHPITARRLVSGLAPPAPANVLDPFCGSGTVLVEARRMGYRAFGVDINPLAVELSQLKTDGASDAEAKRLMEAARSVAAHAEERRRRKAGPSKRYPARDRQLFEPHILLELDGLRDGIDSIPVPELRTALLLVLSALLSKLSRPTSSTRNTSGQRGLASGFAIRFFISKSRELADRLRTYSAELPPRAPRAQVRVGDARRLSHLRPNTIDLVVTSPPYPGVYDYYEQHALGLRWLGLKVRDFNSREIGARRRLNRLKFDEAMDQWQTELGACLLEMKRVCRSTGLIALVLADSFMAGHNVRADEVVERLAGRARLELLARAAQHRPQFYGPKTKHGRMRREHVLLLAPGS